MFSLFIISLCEEHIKSIELGNIIAPAVLSRPRPVRLSPFRIAGTLTRRAALRQF